MNNLSIEHSVVKQILDIIKAPLQFNLVYSIELDLFVKNIYQKENGDTWYEIVNIREILFSDIFMNKYNEYILKNWWDLNQIHINLLQHNLKNPAWFLLQQISK